MAYSVLNTMLEEQDRIFLEPAPYIGLTDLADSSVNITLRAWVSSGDFFTVKQSLTERVYREFDRHGLNIPFPQTDIRIYRP
jgi:small conductance mechanosensitive channel